MLLRTAVVVGALALTGCAKATPPSDAPPSESPPTSAVGQTIRGTVAQGVEAGCTVLNTDGEQYLLLGAEGELPESGEVVLRGEAQPDLVTTCQQGVPFSVAEVVEVVASPTDSPTRT